MKPFTFIAVAILFIATSGCSQRNSKLIGMWRATGQDMGNPMSFGVSVVVEFRPDGTMTEVTSVLEGQKTTKTTKISSYDDTGAEYIQRIQSHTVESEGISKQDLMKANPKYYDNYFSIPYIQKSGTLTLENVNGENIKFRRYREP